MRKRKGVLLLLLDLALVLGLIAGVVYFKRREDARDAASLAQEALSRRYGRTISYQGREYPVKRNLYALLLIGTDNYIDDAKQLDIEAYYNLNLADFLVVLVFDHGEKTVTPVQICRDTMCEVPWISVNGITDGTEFEQITFAHTYGSGKEDSCVNTLTAVSMLMHDAPVDHFFAFTMDAVPVLNDLVGGVKVRLAEDLPALGAEFTRGAEVLLKGQSALRFVRYRDIDVLDSNVARMGRHRQYLEGFSEAAKAALAENGDLAVDAFRAAEPFLCTDLSVENISDITRWMQEYRLMSTLTPEGEYVMGEEFAEFYVDEGSLWDCVRTAYCG